MVVRHNAGNAAVVVEKLQNVAGSGHHHFSSRGRIRAWIAE
jgi:hypothetical protein